VQCEVGKPCRERSSQGAPVMVQIYGGGYTGGDKVSVGNPAGLIARSEENGSEGVIYVALNYRLGLFVSSPFCLQKHLLTILGMAFRRSRCNCKCRSS
jgi:hypothetical protein